MTVAFSPDDEWIVTGDAEGKIKQYEVANGKVLKTFEDTAFVNSVAISPNGKLIASGGRNALAKVWRANNGSQLTLNKDLNQPSTSVAFSPNSRRSLWLLR